ncbi:MAG: hypothetical protein GQ574_28625 [Crocinitomix sp.]|nr:hypothetical protein [Crocinitomix sp.]
MANFIQALEFTLMEKEFNINTVKLKLNRLKLKHSYSEQTGALTIGGATNLTKAWILWFILPLSIALAIIFMLKFEMLPMFGKGRGIANIYGIFLGFPIVFAIIGFFRVLLRMKHNKGEKILSKGKILIKNKQGQEIEILANQINEFDFTITFDKAVSFGELVVIDNTGERHTLFGLQESDPRLLRDDMNYFKSYFTQLVMQN